MNYKIEGAIKRNKVSFIVYIVIWFVLAIFVVSSITYGYQNAVRVKDLYQGLADFGKSVLNPLVAFRGMTEMGVWGEYFTTLLVVSVLYTIFFFIGFIKAAPKNEFTDIEHGSSDWSQRRRTISNLK